MAKKVDRDEVEDLLADVKKNRDQIQPSLDKVKKDIRTIQNMNSFSGKAAEQAKQYFSDVHLTLLGAFHKAFGDLYNRLARHVQTFESEVDSGSNARIQINYLEDLKEDLDDTYGNLQDEKQKINEIIESVSDISTAIAPDFSNVTDYSQKAVETVVELQDDLDAFTQKKAK